jgi:hypothetical protein
LNVQEFIMEQRQLLGDKGQDGNGIKEGHVRRLCVYAGSSWPLQKTKS